MTSPWPEDYYTPVAEMDTNHIVVLATFSGPSAPDTTWDWETFRRRCKSANHLRSTLSDILKFFWKTLDAQTSPSGFRPISWEMHQLQRWSGTSPSFVIVSTTSLRLSPGFPARGIHSLDTRRLPRTSSQKRRSIAALPCSRVWRPGLRRRFQWRKGSCSRRCSRLLPRIHFSSVMVKPYQTRDPWFCNIWKENFGNL